jgi:hypothetical protein
MVKIRHFIEEYSSQLHEIEETLDETLCDVWDFVADPIGLWLEPYEQTNVVELVKTDNPIFNKLTIVFSYITLEIHSLKEIVSPLHIHTFSRLFFPVPSLNCFLLPSLVTHLPFLRPKRNSFQQYFRLVKNFVLIPSKEMLKFTLVKCFPSSKTFQVL